MENIIEGIVQRMEQRSADRTGHKRKQSEGRMKNLLKKIRKGDEEKQDSADLGVKKVHVRWYRWDSDRSKSSYVSAKHGGGYRFVLVGLDECIGKIRQSSMTIFPIPTNDSITLRCPSGIELDESITLGNYLNSAGTYLSKTWFMIQSSTDLLDQQLYTPFTLCACNGLGCVTCIPEFVPSFLDNYSSPQPQKVSSVQFQIGTEALEEDVSPGPSAANLESETVHFPPSKQDDDGMLIVNTPQADTISVASTIPVNDDTVLQETREGENAFKIHRLNLKNDLISCFKNIEINDKITFDVIDPRGLSEEGIGIGKDRDVYSSFWCEALDSLFIGVAGRVPYVRHDLYIDEWTAIGKILCKGFIDTGYFPTLINKAFIMFCLFNTIANDDLIDAFLDYLPSDQKVLMETALKATDQSVYKDEDFNDMMEHYGVRSMVCQLNIYGIVIEIAQQELIQKPFIMVSSWKVSLEALKSNEHFISTDTVRRFYKQVELSNKKMISLLKCQPKTDAERDVLKYFKSFIRSLDYETLRKLLRFLTGSDIILMETIDVEFYTVGNTAARRPIPHLCAPMVELPNSYHSYCELREEFINILKHDNLSVDSI